MDYLVIEGYKAAAEEFSKEAELNTAVDFQTIEDRTNIREALEHGDVEGAITRVNDLDPEVSSLFMIMAFERIRRVHAPRKVVRGNAENLTLNFSLQYDQSFFASL